MLRNPNNLSWSVQCLLGIAICVDLVALNADLRLRSAAAEGITGDSSPLHLALLDVGVTGSLQLLAFIVTGIVFIVWFRRLRMNAEVWAGMLMTRKPGWAVGAWFIPLASLWIPREVAVDIWRASRAEPTAPDQPGELRLLNSWWTFFALSLVMSQGSGRLLGWAETPDEYSFAANLLLATDVLDIIAAVLAILFVRRLTSMQEAKASGVTFSAVR
ncbi:DUF4328 domain-containing protein [Streptomyces sp. NPDC056144]|uniref:DUF4328 domain-containing protein n=1 Tax=unclassified Streptomyces TaxID=2593676 RepID=UPI0035DAFD26